VAFLQAIKEEPEDDTPRLILADWLEERGDPRGELLRLQVTLARLIPGTRAWWARYEREQQLRQLHEKDWLGPLAGLADSYTLQRGLVQLTVKVGDFLGSKVAALAETETFAWVDGVRLTHGGHLPWAGQLERLVSSLLLRGLNALNLGSQALGTDQVVRLLGSSSLVNLTVLELYNNPLEATAPAVLAGSPHFCRLRTLDLDGCQVGDAGAQALAAGTYWALTTLQLRANRIGDAGAEALGRSPSLASLKALHLNANNIGDEGARALADSPHLKGLEALDLQHNPITPPAAAVLRQRFGTRVSV
jgi:uncharacterized protein (TIGR02996 family)